MSESVPAKLNPRAKMAVRGLVAGGLTAVAIPIAGAAALVVLALVAVVVAAISPIAIVLCPFIWATRPEFLRKLKGAKEAKSEEFKAEAAKTRVEGVDRERARLIREEAQRDETQRKLIREAQENARKGARQAREAADGVRQRKTSYNTRASWQDLMDEDAFRDMFKDLVPPTVDPERKKILKKLHNHVRFVNDKTGASAAERATHARLGNELIQKHNITQTELDALKP